MQLRTECGNLRYQAALLDSMPTPPHTPLQPPASTSKPYEGAAADVFTCGVLLYRLLVCAGLGLGSGLYAFGVRVSIEGQGAYPSCFGQLQAEGQGAYPSCIGRLKAEFAGSALDVGRRPLLAALFCASVAHKGCSRRALPASCSMTAKRHLRAYVWRTVVYCLHPTLITRLEHVSHMSRADMT